MRVKNKNSLPLLVFSLVLPQLVGLVGSLFTFPAINSWYQDLKRPSFTPPNWVFGPAWTLLYLLMGLSLYLVLIQNKPKKRAVTIYGLQLFFNSLWSGLFFGAGLLGLALIEIFVLWLLILVTIILFAEIDKRSAWLLVPYLAWVSFASLLNYSFWQLNP